MLLSLEYLPEAERTIETRYPLANGDAFKAVNAAVFYAIGRNNSGRRIEFEAVDGGTLYYVNSAGLVVQIFVLYVSECVALTRFHFHWGVRHAWRTKSSAGRPAERSHGDITASREHD